IEHNFKRYLTPEFQHTQPFWFYIPIMFVAFIPWMTVGVFGLLNQLPKLRRFRAASPFTVLIFCWTMFCVVFFSLSKSKLPGYVLPAVPAAALPLSGVFSTETPLGRRAKGFLLAFTSILFLSFFAFRCYRLRELHVDQITYGQTAAILVVSLFLGLVTF